MPPHGIGLAWPAAVLSLRALTLALVLGPLGLGSALAAVDSPTPSTGCPGYEVLLRAAAQALERGEREHALARLLEARSALEACARKAGGAGHEIMLGTAMHAGQRPA